MWNSVECFREIHYDDIGLGFVIQSWGKIVDGLY